MEGTSADSRPSLLSPGTTLGPYEIVEFIGAGGMGEVYRARDPRLKRDVAIKVISPSNAADVDRLRRVEREAQAVAALNHPNILAIYDVGAVPATPDIEAPLAGTRYLVTELLAGQTLRSLLSKGPLPVRKALDVARDIARGLVAAHARHIVHRDLKPENVFITNDGAVKILDFGLAKVWRCPTRGTTAAATEAGMVLGTVGYMAPEQVRGQPVDHRADIFAFGAVLFEMLTAKSLSGRHIGRHDERNPARRSAGAPPGGECRRRANQVIRVCLEKDPTNGFSPLTPSSRSTGSRMRPGSRRSRRRARDPVGRV